MPYGRERTTDTAGPTQYKTFDTGQDVRTYLSPQQASRYTELGQKYNKAKKYGRWGTDYWSRKYGGEASALQSEAQTAAKDAYAAYRQEMGGGGAAGGGHGTVLQPGQALTSMPFGLPASAVETTPGRRNMFRPGFNFGGGYGGGYGGFGSFKARRTPAFENMMNRRFGL